MGNNNQLILDVSFIEGGTNIELGVWVGMFSIVHEAEL